MTSLTCVGERATNKTSGRMRLNVGEVAPRVLNRTFDTLSVKKRLKVLKSIQSLAACGPEDCRY